MKVSELLNEAKNKEQLLADVRAALSGLTKDDSFKGAKGEFYNTSIKDVKIHLSHDKSDVYLSIAHQQRKGVWHDLGNFVEDPLYKQVKDALGTKTLSSRSDLDSAEAVLKHAKTMAKKLGSVNEAVLKSPKDKQSAIKNLLDKMSDSAAKNLGIHASVDDFRALFVGGDSKGMRKLQQALVDAGYDEMGGSWEDNKLIFQKLGVTKADFDLLVELSL